MPLIDLIGRGNSLSLLQQESETGEFWNGDIPQVYHHMLQQLEHVFLFRPPNMAAETAQHRGDEREGRERR